MCAHGSACFRISRNRERFPGKSQRAIIIHLHAYPLTSLQNKEGYSLLDRIFNRSSSLFKSKHLLGLFLLFVINPFNLNLHIVVMKKECE